MALNNSKHKWVQYAYILIALLMTYPMFRMFFTSAIVNVLCWVVSLVIAFAFSKKFLNNGLFFALLFYIIIVALNFIWGDAYFHTPFLVLNEFFMLFITTSMVHYFINNSDSKNFNLLFLVWGIFLIESSIVTYFVTLENPGLLRVMSSEEGLSLNADVIAPLYRIGLSDYSIPHALPIIIPGLVYGIKNSKVLLKAFYIAVLIASFILANASASVTALLMTILSILLSFSISSKKLQYSKIRIALLTIVFIPILSSQSIQLSLIDTVGDFFPENYQLQKKITDLRYSIINESAEGTVADREEKYSMTVDAITDNLLLGTNDPIGGHSTIPDRLATLGLIGFIPYVLFLCYSIKFALKFIKGPNLYYYYIGVLVALLLLLSKSMSNWPVWFSLFFLLPCMLLFCNKKNELLS